jgi:hypothetical protein
MAEPGSIEWLATHDIQQRITGNFPTSVQYFSTRGA